MAHNSMLQSSASERCYRMDHWCSDFALSASMSADWLRHSFVSLRTAYIVHDEVVMTGTHEEIRQYMFRMQDTDFMHDHHIGVTLLAWVSEGGAYETESLFAVLNDELEEVFGPSYIFPAWATAGP